MNKSPPSDETSKTTSERQHPAPPIARLLQSRLRDSDAPSPLRPQLVRHAPDRLAELGHTDDDDGLEESTDSGSAGEEDVTASCKDERVNPKARNSKTKGRHAHGPPSQPTLVEFREAIDSTVRVPHARSRSSYGTPGLKVKRVSPIREEGDGDSTVSLDTAIMTSEPIRTTSTESTASVETIKGSAAPTFSANAPLRTPSYPFPYVPGSPQSWQQSFHQPFMALSPTVSKHRNLEGETPGKASFTVLSGSSTPAANSIFMPPGTILNAPDDPRFPTPNLYDLVLQLNTEPGLEQWWATVTNILHDHFSAERATLAQPLDPTDIENVPWGQKATFSMFGREDYVSPAAHEEPQGQILQRPDLNLREPSSEIVNNVRPQKLHPERLRPRLEARHSYAGHGREVREVLGSLNEPSARPHNTRPQGPQRTVTHAAGMSINQPPDDRIPPKRFPSAQSLRHGSLSDPDFSSIEGPSDTEPYAEIYSTLRPLDQESRPLIEPSGISHLLERGRMVTITRDYSADQDRPITSRSAPSSSSTGRSDRKLDSFRGLFGPEPSSHRYRGYHEYEQHPQSPWTQSPAPSPAIQADEDINPFFASEDQLLDDTFNPTMSPKDYAQYDQVEALGVDHASTVIHIPLIHPTLSQPMQALRMTPTSNAPVEGGHRTNVLDNERRAPIAILSVLTSAVPYPSNLAHALKLLGPHLATSFQIAQQFSSTHMRAVHIRHRRTTDGGHASFAPMVIEPASLEDIVHAELEEVPRSTSGSMTSPSDYSGRSRISPSGSFAGTPGWDPAAHGWTASRSLVNTPAFSGSEMVDNYFEAKKRTGHRSSSIVSNTLPSAVAKSSKAEQKVTGSNVASSTPGASDTGSTTPRGERTPRTSATGKEDQLPSYSRDRSAPPRGESVSLHRKDRPSLSQLPEFTHARRHSVLHSYGADFEATFGGLPASSPGEPRTPGHARKPSYSEDMPPPSERLLRTIIDSVPVQIFTAQPETGNLSWVNSKFLIYRGQDATQVLKDPWNAIHPDDHRQFLPAWHRSLRTNQQLQQKVRLKRFDGSYRWFYVRAAPLKDKKQKVVHWIGTMMDFHEQQIAEINSARQQETAASEAKYRALANSSPQIVFAVNKAKGVTFCNTQWLQYSGQTEAQALGVGFMEHVHPDDLVKCKLPAFDGDSSQPTNVPTTVPPEPKRAVSQSAASSSGSSETEKPHSSTDSSATSPMHPLPQRELSQMASNGILKFSRDPDGRPSYSTEVRLKSRDGNYRWHLVRVLLAEPLLQHEDEEETWYGTCTDINDHKDLERDMKNTMDAKSRFLSNMSHEIRTPLNGITGMVNFLIDSSLTAEQMEHVNIIRASTEGLRGLINDILDLSKAEAGMIQLNMDWAYVRAIIEEVNDLTSAMAIDKGLELNYIVEEDVPPQVKGDRFRIRQILLNVVGNAIKFTQSGEVFIRCSVQRGGRQLERHELYLKFDVIDTGRGFTDKEADSLFKRFSQIDGSSTRQHGGTGLGLVISKQLAQLHGGDMSAKGEPEKGSTFTFYIKTSLPSEEDRPPSPSRGLDPAGQIPVTPVTLGASPMSPAANGKVPSIRSDMGPSFSPKIASELTQTPPQVSDTGRDSPSHSSASSDPSIQSTARTGSLRSERSSASSITPEAMANIVPMRLALPSEELKEARNTNSRFSNIDAVALGKPQMLQPPGGGIASTPPMFSILVIAPLKYSREATVKHIDQTLPNNVPHQITARESYSECQEMLGGSDPVLFTHIVVVLRDVDEISAIMEQVFQSPVSTTALVLITDLAQRRKILEQTPKYDHEKLVAERKLRFVFKPLKPSRFGLIFDPQKEREMSLDRNQDSAQQVAVNQKQVFEELARRLGNRDKRVLLVEDNRVNQMVILKFLDKVSIKADTVVDGVQCTDKVFAHPPGYYSIILCDLHMPNKDGYQTCKEIRKWEKKNQYAHLPIIALSANVLGDVYQKCVDAGFNSYMTKPVDFKELSQLLMAFMDPSDPSKPHEFMKLKHAHKEKGKIKRAT